MKIKTKVTIGILILVILILAQGLVCNIFLYRFSDASKQVLKDNYRTLQYCKEMIKALDNINEYYVIFELQPNDSINKNFSPDFTNARKIFEYQLSAEENNITEPGEKEAVESLRTNYNAYARLITNAKANNLQQAQALDYFTQLIFIYGKIKNDIITIMNLNMSAITKKSDIAEYTSERAIWYISLIEGLTLIIILPMLFLFPSYIVHPNSKKMKNQKNDLQNL